MERKQSEKGLKGEPKDAERFLTFGRRSGFFVGSDMTDLSLAIGGIPTCEVVGPCAIRGSFKIPRSILLP